jgi:hypothetical protein
VTQLNQFQLTSLTNFYFDIAKAWFVAGIVTPISVSALQIVHRLALFLVGISASWLFVRIGLNTGKLVKLRL